MPRLSTIGEVQVTWNNAAGRYMSSARCPLSDVFDRMRPVPDPIMVTAGPLARPGGDYPWEGNDPVTGRRYVARKQRNADAVMLQEVTD